MSDMIEFDLVLSSEVQIGRSRAVVWPYLDRLQTWKDSVVSVERLAGEPDAVGEVLRIGQRPAGQTVYVRQKTLRREAPSWRVHTLDTEDGLSTNGYVTYNLVDRGDATLVICNVAARVRVPAAAQPGQGAEQVARAANAATQAKLDTDHRALKRVIES